MDMANAVLIKNVMDKYQKDPEFKAKVERALIETNKHVMTYHRGGMPEHDKDAARFCAAIALFLEENDGRP
jgi:hypothetical protein